MQKAFDTLPFKMGRMMKLLCLLKKNCAYLVSLTAFLLTFSAQQSLAGTLIQHSLISDGHAITVWEKSIPHPKGLILMHHGRTLSSRVVFDLQVEGEDLSLMDGLNKAGFSVWAIDARGMGSTPRDSSGWNTPDKASKDLQAALDWLHNKHHSKIHLWGYSWGSMVSLLTTQRRPEHVASLTLFGFPFNPDGIRPVDEPVGDPPMLPATGGVRNAFLVEGSISEKALDQFVINAQSIDPIVNDWTMTHQWDELDATKLNVPTLLLQGEFDPVSNSEAHAKFFPKINNSQKQWVVIKGGDHFAHIENSREQLLSATTSFLDWIDKN